MDDVSEDIDVEDVESSDWWWIDYLENELDPALEKDLETLLAHSSDDRDSFENFRLLKSWVKASDPLDGVDIEPRLMRVHAGVMAEIAKIPSVHQKPKMDRREKDLEAGL